VEGECKIKVYHFLSISKLKAVFVFLPLSLSIIGLILLYHFKRLRVVALYSILSNNQAQKAEYVYCEN
jgi:putative effector of murein hydrolase LrgA (UPF0299 family)